jgi:hypothetical protein
MCECANVQMCEWLPWVNVQMCEWSPWVNVQMCEWSPSFVVIINYD